MRVPGDRIAPDDLEGPCVAMLLAANDVRPAQQVVVGLSLAISAKRQADSLEAIADRLREITQLDMFHPEYG